MEFSYYPGCTLKTKAKELDAYARLSAAALGVQLEEIENWQCCGAVYPQAEDEIATKLSAIRTLNAAKEKEQKLITLCSACHHVLKRVNNDLKRNSDICTRANNDLKFDSEYRGETEVIHYLEMLKNVVGFENIKKAFAYLLAIAIVFVAIIGFFPYSLPAVLFFTAIALALASAVICYE